MSSLSIAMQAAVSGLKANQAGLGVEANNVSNVYTEGYTQKTLPQKTLVLGGQGQGVALGVPQRHVQQTVLSRIRTDLSNLYVNITQKSFLSRSQELLGKPGQNNNLSLGFSHLEKALQGVITKPSEISKKIVFTEAAQGITQQLNQISNGVQSLRQEIDTSIYNATIQLQEELNNVQDLNGRISRGLAIGTPVGDLQDQRDQSIEKIAQIINISVQEDPQGYVSIETSGGRSLLRGDVFQLQYTQTPYMTPQSSYLNVNNGGPGTISPLMLNGYDITQDLSGGTLKGLIDLRDSFLPNMQQQVDLLATQVKTQINAVSNQGSAFPPPTSLTSTRFFNADTDVMGPLTGVLRAAAVHQTTGLVLSSGTLDLSAVQGGAPTAAQFITAFNTTFNGQGLQAALSNGTSGYLVISTTQPQGGVALGSVDAQPAPMGNATQGFSAALGFNDIFLSSGDAQNRGVANTLRLHPSLIDQPGLLPQGLLSTVAVLNNGAVGLTIGDARNTQALLHTLQDRTLSFPTVGSLTTMTGTFQNYAQAVISNQASLVGKRAEFLEAQQKSLDDLRVQEKNLHGVNLDGSMAQIMAYQAAYNANSQVMRIATEMLIKLEEILR